MWYYALNNQQFGPVDEDKIKELVANATINANTMVWTAGMQNWTPLSQTPLASLVGELPPAAPPPVYAPPMVTKDPEVKKLDDLFMWFWISLIGILIFGLGLIPAVVLFFILIHKAWKAVQRDGIRATPDQAVAYCMIPGWNLYWMFPAFRGLAVELNSLFDKENLTLPRINLDLVTWMLICLYASTITFGFSLIPFIVLWIIYTSKVKTALVALHEAQKA